MIGRAFSRRQSSLRSILRVACLGFIWPLAGCVVRREHARLSAEEPGRKHFVTYCASCHQDDGTGTPQGPPLEASSWVSGPEERLIKIVLHGMQGSIEVDGKSYNREMPGFGENLSDEEVASLVSYVRKRFGGASDAITPAVVSRVRAANPNRTNYWTVEELLKKE